MDMKFSALIAMGMNQSNGAVIEVTAADETVRQVVIEDIRGEGDREFIDVLGDGLPKTGLVRVEVELQDWPSEYDAPNYKLISATSVLFSCCDTNKARRLQTKIEGWPLTDPAFSNAS
ncbi:hypothetical protein ACTG10_23690 [Aeromonas hydrophila]|uniref:hypothetical protein n=1 Tax=Aeromonas hydrophila TaxID=644 RepID=UPI003F79EFA7